MNQGRRSRRPLPEHGPRRPDASMTLLREVMGRPLDPGYAAAAARRAGQAPSARRRRAPVTGLLALTCGLLTVAGVLQLRAPAAAGSTAALREQVERRQDRVAGAAASVEALRSAVQGVRARALGGSDDALADQAAALGVLAGEVPVEGPGVRVTLTDAPAAVAGLDAEPREAVDASGRVTDHDLQVVLNGLWTAGAEALALNGHRLTSLSAVRGAGQAVLVDFQRLSPPYELEAVGDPNDLQTAFARTSGGRYARGLDQYGIQTSVDVEDDLELPAGTVQQLDVAAPGRPQPGPEPAGGS